MISQDHETDSRRRSQALLGQQKQLEKISFTTAPLTNDQDRPWARIA
jgi:hypothetical protein